MSFTFAYFGPLTNEITILLSSLNENHNWTLAKKRLYESGLLLSMRNTDRVVSEIKKRFKINDDFLPHLNSVIEASKSNINSISKAQIYYVYLYKTDILVSTMVNYIGEIYENSKLNPVITRKDIKNLLLRYLEYNKKKITSKSIDNWIGRFLSLLKEINMLIPQSKLSYIMNLGSITIEAWTFFIIDAYFKKYNPLNGYFIKAFHIKEDHIKRLIERSSERKWVDCKLLKDDHKTNYIEINTKYSSLKAWLNDL